MKLTSTINKSRWFERVAPLRPRSAEYVRQAKGNFPSVAAPQVLRSTGLQMKTLMSDRILAKTALLVLGLALPVIPQSHGASTILASGVWSGNGHAYQVVQFDLNTDHRWDTARAEIDTLFGPDVTLATITGPEEDAFIGQLLGGGGAEWWIGGFQDPITEPDPAAGWTWVTGEPFLYTHWGYGEPNDGGRLAGEQHLALYFGGLWWNDEGSALGAVAGYVTELQVVPEPRTAALLALGALALSLWRRKLSQGAARTDSTGS